MSFSIKTIGILSVLCATAIGSVCTADDCKEHDTEGTIATLVQEYTGSKVLKIEETIDANGCIELQVRILIDGTVKAITIPNQQGA